MNAMRGFFILAGAAFVASAAVGLAGALKIALPAEAGAWLDFAMLRPLHTFFAIAGVLAGMQGLVHGIAGAGRHAPAAVQALAMTAFIACGAAAILGGQASGREYFTWPLISALALLIALALNLWTLAASAGRLERRSAEAFWLVGLGGVILIASVIEAELWRLPTVAAHYVRNLSLQWHAIDTLFAGINTALYGGAIYLMSDKAKPLRPRALFAVAGFSLLFTFGHHHYVSPQPGWLKSLAVVASMVAVLSFWRHAAAYRRTAPVADGAALLPALWRAVEFWTLVATASGIVFAVPQVNLIVHGTYLVVVHAMGSMIGISVLIVVAGGLALARAPDRVNAARATLGLRLLNGALAALWLDLGAAGLVKGIMRIRGSYADYQPILDMLLVAFPVIGAVMMAGIALLAYDLVRAHAAEGAAAMAREAAMCAVEE